MKYTKVIIAIAACCALGFIIYFLVSGKGDVSDHERSPETEQESDAPEAPPPEEKPQSPPEDEERTDELEAGEMGETGVKLHEVLLAAVEYYRDNIAITALLTQNGFLYNDAAKMTVTADYLLQREYLSRGYAAEGASILYVEPADVSSIVPTFDDSSDELKVFVAVPYEDGYLIDTTGERQTKISTDDFGRLLLDYRTEHGEIRRITGSTGDYAGINAAIKEYQSVTSDFYIRYAMANDKYAVVIVSPKDNYTAIYEYVLVYENDKWQVRIPHLEQVSKTKSVINSVCYDLDVALMPDYDVADYLGSMQTDFEGVTETLIKDGYITEENPTLKYISATNEFLFAKYENGQMFVGVFTDNIWVLGEVASEENALGRFKSVDERAPDFVIIWE